MKSSFADIAVLHANLRDILNKINELTMYAKIGRLKYEELSILQKEFEKYCDDIMDLNEVENK